MTTDTLLTLLNVVGGVLLTGIGIWMANSPPDEEHPKRKWRYGTLFLVLGTAVVVTTVLQSLRTAKEQANERAKHDTEQGRLEDKLNLMADLMTKSGWPTTAQIGAVVKQELAEQKYQRARVSIAEGKLATLSTDLLLKMVPTVTDYLRDFRFEGWYGADREIELRSWSDHEMEISQQPGAVASKTQKEWEEIARRTADKYRAQLVQLLSDAEAIRVALRNKLPAEALTPEDDANAAVFKQALTEGSEVSTGDGCCPASVKEVSDYLDSLAKRVSRIKTLKN